MAETSGWRCRSTEKIMRISLCLVTIFCVFAAIVQMNDPDPLLWSVRQLAEILRQAVYFIPASLTFMALVNPNFMGRGWWRFGIAADLGALLAFSTSFITTAARQGKLSYDVLHSEESRESTGLVIVMLWLALLLCTGPQRMSNVFLASGILVFSIVPLACWLGYRLYWRMHCEVPPHCTGTL